MKKSTFPVLLFLLVTLTAFMPDEYKFEPLPTSKVDHQVYAINDKFVNMYVVKNGRNYVVVDAGSDINNIDAELRKLKIESSKVTAVLLTHSHRDHIAAIALFRNATVYVSKAENFSVLGNKQMKFTGDTVFTIGKLTVRAINTPGHTPGSVSYVVDNAYLFVGDAFSLKNGVVARPNEKYTKDMPTAVKSFEKIKALQHLKYIFTAHTGCTDDFQKAVNTEL